MTTTTLSPLTKQRFVDNNGNPLYLGQLTTYAAGTNTPITTYKDSTGIATNTNPIILNTRGECDLWIQPNVAYKFALTDSAGNIIPGWPIDNIVNSILTTLYGGVDTGSINAYVLTFVANFTAYADGIVIYWIPSHTNTLASTINVNGLGVVNLVNQDGSSLGAGTLVAGQTAVIMYKGGSFLLLSTGNVPLTGTFSVTLTGLVGASTIISYWIVGKHCMLRGGLAVGVSNATTMTMPGLPAVVTPATGSSTVACVLQDNGSAAGGWAQVNSGTNNIIFGIGINNNQSGFTSSGNKGLNAGWCISYPLG